MAAKQIPSPSAKIIAEAFPVRTITDAKGRQITWKRMSILERARFLRAVGTESASNQEFVIIGMMAAFIQSIDGVPNPSPKNLQQIDAAIERMGDDGYQAVSDDLVKLVTETNESLEADVKN